MTENELRKIYYPIAESWKLILEKSGKTQFATEIVAATVNEIDRIMRENGDG